MSGLLLNFTNLSVSLLVGSCLKFRNYRIQISVVLLLISHLELSHKYKDFIGL